MKKKTKIIIITSIIMIVFLIIGLFIGSMRKDKKETKKVMDLIIKDSEKFENSVVSFNEQREKVYSTIFVETYYDTIKENYETWNNQLKDYEQTIDQLETTSKNLKKYCNGMYYSKAEVNEKCNDFSSLYEEVVNTFVNDITSYNKMIKEYNEYMKENNSNETLNEYNTKKKYIDYNKDKSYSGKE